MGGLVEQHPAARLVRLQDSDGARSVVLEAHRGFADNHTQGKSLETKAGAVQPAVSFSPIVAVSSGESSTYTGYMIRT